MTEKTTHDVPRADGTRLLVVWDGGSIALDIPPEGELVIGRGEDADVNVNHGSVSRRHAVLRLGATPTVEDLGSANGTWIDGIRLAPNNVVAVRPNVPVELGSAILMVRGRAHADDARRGIVVLDPEMRRVHELLDVAARSTLPIVLLGETGVGKEVLATRVHSASPRSKKPFVKLNCAALVESLLESELFGHEKGAFTGAAAAKQGLLESADGGTLFLDELGEMPLSTQAKLLRVLETGEVTRIGAVRPKTIDVRFVCATNRDLMAFTREGKFRQDLYYRLDGVTVHVPPLRARGDEVIALAESFLGEASARGGRSLAFSGAALAALRAHSWPGNVRELRNVIARSALFATGSVLHAEDIRFDAVGQSPRSDSIPPAPRVPRDAPTIVPPLPRRGKLDPEQERERVLRALEQCAGNQTRAAELLGIGRRTLLNRLDALNIQRPRKTIDDDNET